MLDLEYFMKQDHSDFPTDTCSIGMSPLGMMFLHGLWKASQIGRLNMAKLYIGLSVIVTACTPSTLNPIMTMHRHSS